MKTSGGKSWETKSFSSPTRRSVKEIEFLVIVRNVHCRDLISFVFRFSPVGLPVAEKTIENFLTRALRLSSLLKQSKWQRQRFKSSNISLFSAQKVNKMLPEGAKLGAVPRLYYWFPRVET